MALPAPGWAGPHVERLRSNGHCAGAVASPTGRPTSRPILAIAPPSRAVPSPSLRRGRAGLRGHRRLGHRRRRRERSGARGWVPRLAQLLGAGTRLRNLGVSGTLIHTALQDQVPAAVREQPDLITVWLAVNDLDAHTSLESYSADLDSLLGTLSPANPRQRAV